jgi:hypothetical protein
MRNADSEDPWYKCALSTCVKIGCKSCLCGQCVLITIKSDGITLFKNYKL